MFNKAVFSLYGFNYPNFVTTLQILVSILYMAILGGLGWFKFSRFKLRAARQVGQVFRSRCLGFPSVGQAEAAVPL